MQNELNQYLEAIRADYAKYQGDDLTDFQKQMREEFNVGLTIEEGKVYYKVISQKGAGSRSVHSFIVKEDGPKFKKGDILKAAGWSAPAKNQARGNIFGQYKTLWTGTWYIRG